MIDLGFQNVDKKYTNRYSSSSFRFRSNSSSLSSFSSLSFNFNNLVIVEGRGLVFCVSVTTGGDGLYA